MGLAIYDLRKRTDVTLLEDRKRKWMSDNQNSLREFYKTDVIPMSDCLSTNLKELQQELIEEIDRLLEVSLTREIRDCELISIKEQKNEMLRNELEKSSSASKDIQANLLKRIKILKNDFKRSQAQIIDFELKPQHQKEKMASDVSSKSRLSTLNDENVLLKTQVDSVVQERENIKLEFQKLFNSIKATQTQHQKEVDELIEHVYQKTYDYADVRSQNQDLLMKIPELKNKIKTIEKGKNVNTKFDKFETSGTLLCVTPLPKNIAVKAKKMSNTKVNSDRSKQVTSHFIPKNEQSQKQSANVIARGIYRITKTETQMPDSKTKMNVYNSTGVESSNSVRRPKSKDTKSKDRVLTNTNDKRPSAHVRKMSSSVSIDSNKCETMHSTMCFFFLHVARYALSRDSKVKRALFTTPRAAKSKNLGATFVVAKSRLSVAKTSTTTNKVIQLVLWIADSRCSKHMTSNLSLLRNFVEKFIRTVCFGNDHFAAITGYGDYVQGNLTICHVYYVEGLGHNLFSVGQFCDGDLEVAFCSNMCYVWNLEGDDLLTGSRESNLYTISISESAASSLVCLMSKATSTKSWLWHRRISHLNFGTINQLTSKDLVDGLPKYKYNKDHLCSACEGKSKKASPSLKNGSSTESKLELSR
ncbi:retrovirus-related pol polyprotein from transposon TNT 1-94 [Tanacetum coccineum]